MFLKFKWSWVSCIFICSTWQPYPDDTFMGWFSIFTQWGLGDGRDSWEVPSLKFSIPGIKSWESLKELCPLLIPWEEKEAGGLCTIWTPASFCLSIWYLGHYPQEAQFPQELGGRDPVYGKDFVILMLPHPMLATGRSFAWTQTIQNHCLDFLFLL